MLKLELLKNYKSKLNITETEYAIKLVKDTFEQKLAQNLNLIRVSAPLFVLPKSGLNDDLSGAERPVDFDIPSINENVQIVQSLAKWKRVALKRYDIPTSNGIYTDMNAIRRDEVLDNIHSVYVDQWDWEKIIIKDERNVEYLKSTINSIYQAMVDTQKVINDTFKNFTNKLPSAIFFITSSELEMMYPNNTPKERENLITKEYQAVFISQIGWPLKNNQPHDLRAADYDDWLLNGDILVWCDSIDQALELSSMGIRVDDTSLKKQLEYKNELHKLDNPYAKSILDSSIPLSIGGGIGQSRLCLFFLEKVHIGEVQASIWSSNDLEILEEHNIKLL